MSGATKKQGDNPLEKCLFIMGNFPAPSQTFILREMRKLAERGVWVNVLADTEVDSNDMDETIAELKKRANYLPKNSTILANWIRYMFTHPIKAARLTRWALSLPHRTKAHRTRFIGALGSAITVAPVLKKQGITYVHAHFAAFQTEVAMCLSKVLNIPYGATWHAYGIWKDKTLLKEKIAGARTVLTCTAFNLEHLRNLAPEHKEKIHLVHHGIEFSGLNPQPLDEAESIPLIICIGRLTAKKGFNYLVDAVSLLRKKDIPIRVEIIGDGPLREELQQQIDDLDLAETIRLCGEMRNEDVMNSLRRSCALAAPSVRDKHGDIDGIPNVLLEAMAMQRAVIGTKLSGLPEVVIDGKTGLLVEPEDAQGLARALERIVTDSDFAKNCGLEGRRLVEESFNLDRNVDQQLELLQEARSEG